MSKKIFCTILAVMCMLFHSIIVYANEVSLSQVVDSFNNCETVKTYQQYHYTLKAEIKNNNLWIIFQTPEATSKFEFKVEGSILSCSFSPDEALTGLLTTSILVDSVGQIHGYEDGELFDTLNSEQIVNYTVENEGFEIKETEDGRYSVKIDIKKKLTPADLSNVYIEMQDVDDFLLDILVSDEYGSFYASKGEIAYKVEKYGDFIIYFAEKNELTERTYQSILTLIRATFENENAVKYFQNNYANIDKGNHSFDGFEIVINPSNIDLPEFKDNYKVLELVIDKERVKEIIEAEKTTEPKTTIWSYASEWAITELNKAQDNNLIPIIFKGADLTANITRLEFAHVAVVLYEKMTGAPAKIEGEVINPFRDTADGAVVVAYNLGITNGTSDTTFTPDKLITREQMATMILRTLTIAGIDTNIDLKSDLKFADDNEMHDWSRNAIYFMANQGIIKGVGNNVFDVNGTATKEQALLISVRSAEKFEKNVY